MTGNSAWRAVADPTRRRLIELLRDGPRTTGDLCRAFATTRFAVMKHLAVLERAGIVKVRREGRLRWNVLDPEPLRGLEGRWPAGRGPAGEDAGPTPSDSVARASSHPVARASLGLSEVEGWPAGPAENGLAASVAALSVFVDAPPWRVFDALTMNVAAWWGAPHLLSGDASNLALEPQPGGRFFEEWGHRQGALRGVVVAIKQDERVAIEGAVFGGGAGVLDFRLERREGGTLVRVTFAGASPAAASPAGAAATLDDLVRTRMKAFVERGVRSGVAG